jgi:hypothetical protein
MTTISTIQLPVAFASASPAFVAPEELFVLALEERLELATLDTGHDKCTVDGFFGE